MQRELLFPRPTTHEGARESQGVREVQVWLCSLPDGRLAVSVQNAALLLDCSEKHVRRQIKDGVLRAVPFGRKVLIPMGELERVLASEALQGTNVGTTQPRPF